MDHHQWLTEFEFEFPRSVYATAKDMRPLGGLVLFGDTACALWLRAVHHPGGGPIPSVVDHPGGGPNPSVVDHPGGGENPLYPVNLDPG